MKKTPRDRNLVYSSDHGRMCSGCGHPSDACECPRRGGADSGDGVVRLSRETKGRKGKGVTLITGVPLDADDLKDLARQLKQKCGTGGTVRNGVIEIQGDHRDKLFDILKQRGWTVKKAGG